MTAADAQLKTAAPRDALAADLIVEDPELPRPINRYYRRDWVPAIRTLRDLLTRATPADDRLRALVLEQRASGAWAPHPGSPVDRGLTVLNYSALLVALRRDPGLEPALRADITSALRGARRALTGRRAPDAELLSPLPTSALWRVGRVARVLHQAATAPSDAAARRALERALTLFRRDADYLTYTELLLLLAAALAAPQLVLGLFFGLTAWNLSETFLHSEHYHADRARRDRLAALLPRRLNARVEIARLQHRQHHAAYVNNPRAGTNYSTPIYEVDLPAAARRRALLERKDVAWIADEGFGDRFGWHSGVLYGLIGSPVLAPLLALAWAAGASPWGILALLVGYAGGVWNTAVCHRLLHRAPEARRREAADVLKPYVMSHHFEFMARMHGGHHMAGRCSGAEEEEERAPPRPGRFLHNQIAPGPLGNVVFNAVFGLPGTLTREQLQELKRQGF